MKNKIAMGLGIALLVLLVGAMGAAAVKPEMVKINTNGASAYADFIETFSDGSIKEDKYVAVWKTGGQTTAFISFYSNEGNGNYKNEYGVITANDIFEINVKKLDTARLTIPAIQMGTDICDQFLCYYMRTRVLYDVQIDWTGSGSVREGGYIYKFRDGSLFTFRSNEKSFSRDAVATGFGTTNYASLNSFKSAEFQKIRVGKK